VFNRCSHLEKENSFLIFELSLFRISLSQDANRAQCENGNEKLLGILVAGGGIDKKQQIRFIELIKVLPFEKFSTISLDPLNLLSPF
jgi:hypothetical protein